MSLEESQAAARKHYENQVPDMNPEMLRKMIEVGPATQREFSHQKISPNESALRVENKRVRPLPMSRSKVVMTRGEVGTERGLLTQTQILELLPRRHLPQPLLNSSLNRGGSSGEILPESVKALAKEFHIGEADVALVLRYFRAPDIRINQNKRKEARWHWEEWQTPATVIASQRQGQGR
ncbi:unnamed protein product [Discosporangium mesarthrocarpum]